ncbi:MAG TPA: YdcF family protein [Candidatus Paceibacterota bacterium]
MYATILVIGSSIEPDGKGGWRTNQRDREGIVDSSWRIHAAAYLQRQHRCPLIVSAGTAKVSDTETIAVSSVMRAELIQLGADPRQITEESSAGNTYEQLVNGARLTSHLHSLAKICILSSEWHLPRIQTMLHAPKEKYPRLPNFAQAYGDYELVGAEPVLVKFDPGQWIGPVSAARSSVETLGRIKKEQWGIRQILEGTYKLY